MYLAKANLDGDRGRLVQGPIRTLTQRVPEREPTVTPEPSVTASLLGQPAADCDQAFN